MGLHQPSKLAGGLVPRLTDAGLALNGNSEGAASQRTVVENGVLMPAVPIRRQARIQL
jgi:hypothetical protein